MRNDKKFSATTTRKIISAYDSQGVRDTFLRYTPSLRLLELLATFIGMEPNWHHIDVGFSGRLALPCCLATYLTVINHSFKQLQWGEKLLERLIEYYENEKVNKGSTLSEKETLLPDWFHTLTLVEVAEIRKVLDEQIQTLEKLGRKPKMPDQLRLLNTTFTYKTDGLESDAYNSLTMVDVLVHVDRPEDIFSEIRRVLKVGGHALVSFYPARPHSIRIAGVEARDGWAYADRLYARLASKYRAPFDMVYDSDTLTVFPAALAEELKNKSQLSDTTLIQQFWLDLPQLQLYSEEALVGLIRRSGLLLVRFESAPGGMLPAIRRVAILRKLT